MRKCMVQCRFRDQNRSDCRLQWEFNAGRERWVPISINSCIINVDDVPCTEATWLTLEVIANQGSKKSKSKCGGGEFSKRQRQHS